MSIEQVQAFLERVKVDSDLQERLASATDLSLVAEVARNAGFEIQRADLVRLYAIRTTELSDEELERMADTTVFALTFFACPPDPTVGCPWTAGEECVPPPQPDTQWCNTSPIICGPPLTSLPPCAPPPGPVTYSGC